MLSREGGPQSEPQSTSKHNGGLAFAPGCAVGRRADKLFGKTVSDFRVIDAGADVPWLVEGVIRRQRCLTEIAGAGQARVRTANALRSGPAKTDRPAILIGVAVTGRKAQLEGSANLAPTHLRLWSAALLMVIQIDGG